MDTRPSPAPFPFPLPPHGAPARDSWFPGENLPLNKEQEHCFVAGLQLSLRNPEHWTAACIAENTTALICLVQAALRCFLSVGCAGNSSFDAIGQAAEKRALIGQRSVDCHIWSSDHNRQRSAFSSELQRETQIQDRIYRMAESKGRVRSHNGLIIQNCSVSFLNLFSVRCYRFAGWEGRGFDRLHRGEWFVCRADFYLLCDFKLLLFVLDICFLTRMVLYHVPLLFCFDGDAHLHRTSRFI